MRDKVIIKEGKERKSKKYKWHTDSLYSSTRRQNLNDFVYNGFRKW